jgi:NAD(P)-dependent dehydrogenase (short-subunit alcohol dehydrogenase family)
MNSLFGRHFEGKVAIVTGGGSGIGRAVALDFAAAGAAVVVSGRTAGTLDETIDLITRAGGKAFAVAGDVGCSEDVRKLIRATVDAHGCLDILINNAGVSGSGKLLCDVDESEFDEIFAVNARGTFLGMKYAIPEMLRGGGGCIVNVSSKEGLVGSSGKIPYIGSKHAVVGMTKAAAVEYAQQGIRVNAVCPAAHDSAMVRKFASSFTPEAWDARVKAVYPVGRTGQVEDVSAMILFLCSAGASNIHGVAMPIDGGFTAQ